MKNLALALAMTLFLTACSSGSTVAPLDVVLNGTFTGSFANTDGNQEGTAVLNLTQAAGGTEITGNAIFDITVGSTSNVCLLNGLVTGTNNGPSASITIQNGNLQLAISNNGDTLSGTYVVTVDTDLCSNGTGSGNITLTRS